MNNTIKSSFLMPKCSLRTLDNYLIRQSILNAITIQLNNFHGKLLDVGCGQMPYKSLVTSSPSKVAEYIGLDFENNAIHDNQPDITWINDKIPLNDNSIDCVLCTEVFEHCSDVEKVMKEIFRVLKPNGVLFFTVPFLWPLHEVPYDHYRYTPFSLRHHLTQCYFTEIVLKPMGGWDASLAQMLGLWVRRKPMGRSTRKCLSLILLPIIWTLGKIDKKDNIMFSESDMLTGISGTARKP